MDGVRNYVAQLSLLSFPDLLSLFVPIVLIFLVMVIGDAIVYSWPATVPRVYWALLDPPVHIVLALLVVSPLFGRRELVDRPLVWITVAAVAAVLIDLDHFWTTQSFSMQDALNLSTRPLAHSLLFVLLGGVLALLFTRQAAVVYLIIGVLLSHVLRDASHGGVPLFWPLESDVRIALPLYHATQIGLFLLAAHFSGWPASSLWTQALWHSLLKALNA